MKRDTIAAIATGMSNGGISIIRISGEDSLAIADKIYRSKSGRKKLSDQESHTVHYGYIYDGEDLIDEVIVVIMKNPNSYTREDVVEINCHGGMLVTKRVLETVIKYGARTAEPGEFTRRAFLNGRIDLSQAEAVIDVINAKNKYALSSSVNQLKGTVLYKIREVRESILHDTAFIEAALDDPEHISVDGFADTLKIRVEENLGILRKLKKSADNGRILKEGVKTVILGKPNAGKSSLLNVLLGEERAIVTDIEGTTRDTLEETIQLDSVMLQVMDTAGIRETADVVEQIGVEKARSFAEQADLLLYLVDASREFDENDTLILNFIKEKLETSKVIILLNKQDLDTVITKEDMENLLKKYTDTICPILTISTKNETGIDSLEDTLKELFYQGKLDFNDEICITNVRQKEAIEEAIDSLQQVIQSIEDQMPEDFYSIDLMNAYEVLGKIIGEAVEEDLVNKIFKEFCMGK